MYTNLFLLLLLVVVSVSISLITSIPRQCNAALRKTNGNFQDRSKFVCFFNRFSYNLHRSRYITSSTVQLLSQNENFVKYNAEVDLDANDNNPIINSKIRNNNDGWDTILSDKYASFMKVVPQKEGSQLQLYK